jgi:hypothetical protein
VCIVPDSRTRPEPHVAHSYSITSSASASGGGTSMPSAFAVSRLIAKFS